LYEETLVLLKPDALERRLVGRILQRYEEAGIEILDVRYYRTIRDDMISRHYPDSMAQAVAKKAKMAGENVEDLKVYGLTILERLRRYVTRGPIIALKLGGEDAIHGVRKLTGYTDPSTAEEGTIRGDFGVDSIRKSAEEGRAVENLIHASGNAEEAKVEIALWFPKKP
jgi:nucleoside-diphosphate kinase